MRHFLAFSWWFMGGSRNILWDIFVLFVLFCLEIYKTFKEFFLWVVFLTFLCCFLGWFTGPSRNILLHSSGEGRRFPDSNNEVGTFSSSLDFTNFSPKKLSCCLANEMIKAYRFNCFGISFDPILTKYNFYSNCFEMLY